MISVKFTLMFTQTNKLLSFFSYHLIKVRNVGSNQSAIDSMTKTSQDLYQAIDLASAILRHKKSARISLPEFDVRKNRKFLKKEIAS